MFLNPLYFVHRLVTETHSYPRPKEMTARSRFIPDLLLIIAVGELAR